MLTPGYGELLNEYTQGEKSKEIPRANNSADQRSEWAYRPLVLAANTLAPLAGLLFSEQILDVLTSRQRKQPGLRTAIITAPFFSQSSFALKVLGSGEKRQISILSSQPSLAPNVEAVHKRH